VTVDPQRLGEKLRDVRLVVHDQDRSALRRLEPRLRSAGVQGLGGRAGWKLDGERGAAPGCRLKAQDALVPVDDASAQRESQPRSLPGLLRREERAEDSAA
jgi:hypothetical protein